MDRPLFSVIVPIYNTPRQYLEACVRSVLDQTYENWELILIDDCSTDPDIWPLVTKLSDLHGNVTAKRTERNSGISGATNLGVATARGQFLAFVDHDDELVPNSLSSVADAIGTDGAVDIAFTDQVKIDENGLQIDHFHKPSWSPTYALGVMYVGHLLVVRTELLKTIGGFDSSFDGVQDYECLLRLTAQTAAIKHIPLPLYKWRAIPGSVAAAHDAKGALLGELQLLAARAHLRRIGRSWHLEKHPDLPHRIRISPGQLEQQYKVSIIIPTRDQGDLLAACLGSIFQTTDSANFEIILVDNGTTDKMALEVMARWPVKIVHFDREFNFSAACNEGAAASTGEYLLFLNNDTEVSHPKWLSCMAAYFEDEGVGAVGPLLLYPDGRVQHAGVVLGARGTADHAMRFFPANVDGYGGSLCCTREVSAVTAACLMMRRSVFDEIRGFSEDYAKHYQDVDLCLKLREKGYRILYVAHPAMIHHESVTRKSDGYDMGDRAILIDRWFEIIAQGDPYYNKVFSLEKLDYSFS